MEQLVRDRYPALVGHAALVSSQRAEAEDLVHEALIATFTAGARFATVAEAEQYVRRAIISRSIDGSRRRTRERAAVVRLAGRARPPAELEPVALGEDVRRALMALSPRERACVVLRLADDLSVRETAAQLGLSEGAVKRYTSDGVARLDRALSTQTAEPEVVTVRSVEGSGGAS
ncbi:RNA polymerase sigma factor [Cellulomonas soli]